MTATTQPNPEVVAWMRGHQAERPITNASIAIRAWLTAHGFDTLADSPHSLRELSHAYYAAARKPLTVADIPAGQGPASLHITPTGGRPALWFKADDGTLHFIRWAAGPGDTPPARALWDHLVATITHVTTEESQ